MIHLMEEDSPSIPHSFRTRRQVPMNPGKRARSPEGPSPDRPSKRPSLVVGGISRRPDYRHLSLGSASSSLGTSEDWVQQTGGLSIDSPIFPLDREIPFVGGEDVDMMDSEESSVNELLGRTQSFHFSNTGIPQQAQQPPEVVPQTPHHGTRADRLFTNVDPPMMNVVPAAPINVPQAPEEHASFGQISVPQPSTPAPSSPVLMAISPTTSMTQIGSSRRRVVFGPRANCDKCRLGAPGHFAHYE